MFEKKIRYFRKKNILLFIYLFLFFIYLFFYLFFFILFIYLFIYLFIVNCTFISENSIIFAQEPVHDHKTKNKKKIILNAFCLPKFAV